MWKLQLQYKYESITGMVHIALHTRKKSGLLQIFVKQSIVLRLQMYL